MYLHQVNYQNLGLLTPRDPQDLQMTCLALTSSQWLYISVSLRAKISLGFQHRIQA